MNLFIYQLKQAMLSLKLRPNYVFSIIATMGLTLGALIFVSTLAYVMLIKPLPYPEQDRLFTLTHQLIDHNNEIDGDSFTYPNLMYLYRNQEVFDQQALNYLDAAVITSLASKPMKVINFVTPQWFDMLAIPMAIGRGFEKTEQLDSYHHVAVISHQTWQQDYNAEPDILDKKIDFGGKSFRIIGVIANDHQQLSLAGPKYNAQIYIPWDFNSVSDQNRKTWGNDDGALMYLGKTASADLAKVSAKQHGQKLTQLVNDNWQNQVQNQAFFKDWSIQITSTPLKNHLVATSKHTLYLLIAGAFGLTFIACANIANLFISRVAERQQQFAILAALGAKPKQLFTAILAEIGLLMFVSLVVAQMLAMLGFTTFHQSLSEHLPRINELALNGFSLLISLILLLILSLIFSLICVKMIHYRTINRSLQTSGKGNSFQVSKSIRKALIVSQITIASTLIFINILLFENAQSIINQPLGYQSENIYAVVLSAPNLTQEQRITQIGEIKKHLANSAKISAVSQAMRPSIFSTLAITAEKNNQRYTAAGKDVDEHYFPMIEQAIIAGDNFTSAQIQDNEPVILVNETFAKKLAPDGNIIGTRFTNGARVIGVVKSIQLAGNTTERDRFYYPASRARNMLLIKTKANQTLSRDEVLRHIQAVDQHINIFSFSSLDKYKERRLFSATTTAQATIALTLITCFLSGIGLYGILKYTSQMRRFEIGTRMAIGAKGKDIIRLIFGENIPAMLLGFVLSLLILTGLYLGLAQQVSNFNLWQAGLSFITSAVLITLLTLYACYLPLTQYIKQPVMLSLRNSE